MLALSIRPATLKYLTRGSSGVAGLKTSLRYDEVRFAYAGESTIERRRVVKEDGSEASESVKGRSVFSDFGGGVGESGASSPCSSWREATAFEMSFSVSRSFPIPMFSCQVLVMMLSASPTCATYSTPVHERTASVWGCDAGKRQWDIITRLDMRD